MKIGLMSLIMGLLCLAFSVKAQQTKDIKATIKVDPLVRAKQNARLAEQPEDFPQFVHTGDPAGDRQRYIEAKTRWINDHPEAYPQPVVNKPQTLRKADFDALPEARRKAILARPNQYSIVE